MTTSHNEIEQRHDDFTTNPEDVGCLEQDDLGTEEQDDQKLATRDCSVRKKNHQT
jgi:hypothetical protein